MNKPANLMTVENILDELPDDTLHMAMARAFAEIEAATKSADNDAFKKGGKASKYADFSAVIDAIKPALIANGLFVTQRCHPDENGVSVETVLHHRSGEDMSLGVIFVPADKRSPHGFGSALTYAKRYGLQTAFVVPAEDDDGNAASLSSASTSRITQEQFVELEAVRDKAGVSAERFCKRFQIEAIAMLPADQFEEAKTALAERAKVAPELVK